MQNATNIPITRAIVAAVHLNSVSDIEFASSLNELRELAKTLGYQVVGTFVQKRATFDTTAYLGVGKRREIRQFVEGLGDDDGDGDIEQLVRDATKKLPAISGAAKVKARETAQAAADEDSRMADIVLIDHEVSPSQARNLEIEVGCDVMDRTMVILEIFQRHASSRSARAQVEIAQLGYMAPRLREAAKRAGPKGRQRSGTGGVARVKPMHSLIGKKFVIVLLNCKLKLTLWTQNAKPNVHAVKPCKAALQGMQRRVWRA